MTAAETVASYRCELSAEVPVQWVQVKYAALPNFEEREEDFRAESVLLRRRFTDEGQLHHR